MLDREEMELDEAEPTIFFSNSGGDALFDSLFKREAMADTILLVCADTLLVARSIASSAVRSNGFPGWGERARIFISSFFEMTNSVIIM